MASVITSPNGSGHWIGNNIPPPWPTAPSSGSGRTRPDLDIVAQQRLHLLGPVGLLVLVFCGDTHDQPPPGPSGRLDGQMGAFSSSAWPRKNRKSSLSSWSQ